MIDGLAKWTDEDWAQLGTKVAKAIMDWQAQMVAAGRKIIQWMMDGAIEQFDNLLNWFAQMPARIKEAIGKIDLSSMISWPSWLPGGPAAPAGANDNAPAAAPAPGKQSFVPVSGRQMADAGFASPASVAARSAAGGAPQSAEVSGRIVVEAAPGTRVQEATSDTSSVSLVAGTGRVVGRV